MAARAGDQQAQDELVTGFLPLVYNIVGRALRGHADVDDVVQEVMLRMLQGLDGLRDPDRFRSWLVAVTMNEIRRHWHRSQASPTDTRVDDVADLADPATDFVDLTILRLGLAGQRREVAEATRWLDENDRALLSLWWLEAAGELTREEVATAMELTQQHTAVRVQRMKIQLETARVVVRALSAEPRCGELLAMVAHWDGVPSALWRKRIARHARGCAACSGYWIGLVPAEGLLVGLGLVPPAAGLLWLLSGSHGASVVNIASVASRQDIPGTGGGQVAKAAVRRGAHRAPKAGGRGVRRILQSRPRGASAVAGGAAVTATAAAAALTLTLVPSGGHDTTSAAAVPRSVPATTSASSPGPEPSVRRSTSTPPARPKAAPSRRETTAASRDERPARPPLTPSPTPTPRPSRTVDPAQQVLAVINKARADHGLPPYTLATGLTRSAQAHNTVMDDGCGLSHQCPGEAPLGDRETAQGVHWGAAGENIGQASAGPDPQQIASAAVGLTQSMLDEKPPNDGHRQNILSTTFRHVGIGVHRDANGTVWLTQDFSD
ncbi:MULTISPECIES: sigma-70 family RNA polymerase sigma factor [Streptomyces]|uniref:Sigma-70 family RNA polymerase sigma factor n=1 Tax=Streptomyces bugieae TaxID=3098223 RepID=A0ABU7NZQ2_9ACTN|nr:sigma-70 family RNA polymerase sigma factor [Streptomyces nigrescens]MEE4424333.1 sigma-70 family RNA polymerase sigma factor [Streptomyces sp. DSM 41528]